MKITLDISAERIANLMISAIESGDPVTTACKGGWCWGIYWHTREATPRTNGLWYAKPAFWRGNFKIQIVEVEDENLYDRWLDDDGNIKSGAFKVHTLHRADFVKGLTVMAEKYSHLFGEILNDNSDAPCADIFLQCVLFGEEKYA
jgi:hypothetical protein